MAYPVSFKLAWWGEGLAEGSDFRDCQIGDSMTTEGNLVSSFGLGKARMWRVPVYVGECHRGGTSGPTGTNWSSGTNIQADHLARIYQDTVWSSAATANGTNTERSPGATAADLSTGWMIGLCSDYRITGNPADLSTIYRCDFGTNGANKTDLNNYANGNPYTDELTVRLIYHSKPTNNGSGQLKIGMRRDAVADGTPSLYTITTTEGVSFADYTRTSATNPASRAPGILITSTAGDDTGLHLHIMGAAVFQSTSGVRKTGYFQSYFGVGSYTTENILAMLGGGASPTCLDLYVQGYLQHGCMTPNRFTHWYGQNATAAEATEYASGGYSIFKANVLAILDKLDAQMLALGVSDHRHLLVSGYEGGTDAYNALRSQALYEIAKARPNCAFISVHEVMPANPYPASVTISSHTIANPTVITTATPHGLSDQQQITIAGSSSTPTIDGKQIATVISSTTFSIPINVTGGARNAGTFQNTPWWLHYDGIHPRGTGVCIAAACLWNMVRAIRDANTYEYRREELRPFAV